MNLSLGFSPCPNDTFIFDALVNGKLESNGLTFSAVLEDVQTLNAWAMEEKLDVTKLSFPALFETADRYRILDAGAALGKGVGPLLVARETVDVTNIQQQRIAIPGENTTAHFLLNYAFPEATDKVTLLFSDIEDAVCRGDVDLGVIIHENRFTYQQKGLVKICDLGAVWEEREGLPIPLGCIAIKRALPSSVKASVDGLIRQSLDAAFAQYPLLPPFVRNHSQAMEESVMRKHIELYVNDFSLSLGEEGRKAIEKLYAVYNRLRNRKQTARNLFQ